MAQLNWQSKDGVETAEQNGHYYGFIKVENSIDHWKLYIRQLATGILINKSQASAENCRVLSQIHADAIQKAIDEAVEKAMVQERREQARLINERDQSRALVKQLEGVLDDAYECINDAYDGAPDSPTRGNGSLLLDMAKALAAARQEQGAINSNSGGNLDFSKSSPASNDNRDMPARQEGGKG